MKVREKQRWRLHNVLKKNKPNPLFKDIRLVPFHSENDRAVLTQTQLSPRRWIASLLVAFRCYADILGISETLLRRVTATPQEEARSLGAPRSALACPVTVNLPPHIKLWRRENSQGSVNTARNI